MELAGYYTDYKLRDIYYLKIILTDFARMATAILTTRVNMPMFSLFHRLQTKIHVYADS